MAMSDDERKASSRARTAKYRAKIGRAACAAQARALYHQHDDDPVLHEAKLQQGRERASRWYANHTEQRIADVMARIEKRAADPELAEIDRLAQNMRTAKWRESHPEEQKAATDAWRAAHPEQINETRRKSYAEDPSKPQANCAAYRARKKNAPRCDFTAEQWKAMQEAYNHCCAYCGKRAKGHLTQDHITPLSRGGSHTLSNIVPACRSCNSKKGTGAVLKPVQPLLL